MWDQINPWLAGGGLTLGMAFGIVAQRSRFCVVAAVSNFALMRDYLGGKNQYATHITDTTRNYVRVAADT